jgi:serine/threonine protein kinase
MKLRHKESRCRTEREILVTMKHPNIVRCFGTCKTEKFLYFLMVSAPPPPPLKLSTPPSPSDLPSKTSTTSTTPTTTNPAPPACPRYCTGTELYKLLKRVPNARFEENEVKFYASQILIALEHLHLHNYVYR